MGEYRLSRRKVYKGRERRSTQVYPRYLMLATLGLMAIIFATLCPIELRPHLGSPVEERFGAYFVLGMLATMAVPRQQTAVSLSLVAIAFALEAAQRLVPTRDAAVPDAVIKAFGGMLGAQFGVMTFAARRWMKEQSRRRIEASRARRAAV
jgi:hypothetical protein